MTICCKRNFVGVLIGPVNFSENIPIGWIIFVTNEASNGAVGHGTRSSTGLLRKLPLRSRLFSNLPMFPSRLPVLSSCRQTRGASQQSTVKYRNVTI